MQYLLKAYFIFDDTSESLVDLIKANTFGTEIFPYHVNEFLNNSASLHSDVDHLVLSVSSEKINDLFVIAYRYGLSIGVVPLPSQDDIIKILFCSSSVEENIELALRSEHKMIDAVEVNSELTYLQGVIGKTPLIGREAKHIRHSFFGSLVHAIKEFFIIELQTFEITTENGRTITTAGSGIVLLNHTRSGLLSRIFNFNQSMRDGEITVVIISPVSILEYVKLLTAIFTRFKKEKSLPSAIGYVKSKSMSITASRSTHLYFENGDRIDLPITCKIIPEAVPLNASDEFWLQNEKQSNSKESIKIDNLPDKNETEKYTLKHIPFFTFASEERFKELFQQLRVDARVNQNYLFLMVLSTLLASIGLFANSAAVIIGAMLLAPLMTPIVSFSMGLLRAERDMIAHSLLKIFIGVALALLASSLLGYFSPYAEVTQEMRSRINPTLLDLGVAIVSGIAAAYSKSFKEIAQNLAGVAIAVALVPPLATAGIGLGHGDIAMFSGAFLLFFTNLIGITLAAVVTFLMLGFSNVLKSKKSIAFIAGLLVMISFPLYSAYDNMIQKYEISQMLHQRHFLVNGKNIIINSADVELFESRQELELELLVTESLDRNDFESLQEEIEKLFDSEVLIKARVEYIL